MWDCRRGLGLAQGLRFLLRRDNFSKDVNSQSKALNLKNYALDIALEDGIQLPCSSKAFTVYYSKSM